MASALAVAMSGTTAACDRHAVAAEATPGDFQRAKLTALIALITFHRRADRRFIHDSRSKFSAIAMALRMDMDLLIVS